MTKIHIKTYGCSMNQADSETMEAILKDAGHEIVDYEDSELVIFNTCTVKNPTESKIVDEVTNTKQKKKVIIAGCIAQAQPSLFKEETQLGVEQLSKVTQAVTETLKGSNVMFLRRSDEERVKLPSIRKNKHIEIIPINKGCSGTCTFCKTKAARGVLKSFPKRDIVSRAQHAIAEGIKEIWLTSQDTGAYGLDIGTSLPDLVNKIANNKGDFMIRIGMTNPEYVLKYEKELVELFKHPKIYKFLHVPVQSGSQEVLDKMIRPYNIEEVFNCLKRIKKEIPEITLSTDIIAGFPGETDDDWEETMKFVKEINFPIINISKFYKRPGTKAYKMKQLNSKIAKNRTRELTEWLINRKEESLIGQNHRVLINELGEDGAKLGKTMNYRQVIVDGECQLGEFVNVVIKETKQFYSIAQIL